MTSLTVAWSPSSFGEADDAPIRLLARLGISVRPNPFGRRLTEEEAIQHLGGVDGLIAGLEPLNRRVLSSADRLRAVARVGIGVDNVDHEAAGELGIRVSNTPDAPAAAVAELTIASALSLLRGLGPANEALHQGQWRKTVTQGLGGTAVLLIGFGRIGRAVARLFQAFGARLMVVDPEVAGEGVSDVELVTLVEGLGRARVVSVHASGRSCILGEAELRAVGPGTFLLNSARGELVDEAALCRALDDGRIAGAWFDVFREEPYSGPLIRYDQVLLTPHVGTYTVTCRKAMEMQATVNLLSDLGVEVPS
jgi:D-3-phosphoglycerate dehydrogenase